MDVDYHKLCASLFETDDVNELTKIVRTRKERNPRNAGRKKKFTSGDAKTIRRLTEGGMTVNEVVERLQTPRQVIGKYLNGKPAEDYALRMTYMYQQRPCTTTDVDFLNQRVMVQNKTKDMLHRAFGIIENPTWNGFEMFLKDRCFPVTRGNAKKILKEFQLTFYDLLQIIEKTRGRTAEDDMWLKFNYYPVKEAVYGHHQF